MKTIVIRLVVSLLLTLVFEILAARLMGVRHKRDLVTVGLINCATNPPLVFLLSLIPFFGIYGIAQKLLLVLELLVTGIEGFVYRLCALKRPFLLSLVLNIASYVGVLCILQIQKLI